MNSDKSENLKLKKKRVQNASKSSRKNKVKSKQANYQPMSGTIDLVSRNERSVTQVRNENSKLSRNLKSMNSFLTPILETAERTKIKSKNRFLVSKKYNNAMMPAKSKNWKENAKSYLTSSMKFGSGPSTSMSKYITNNTNIGDVYTPTSTTSHKINIKGSLLAKKKIGASKKCKKSESAKEDSSKNYKTIKTILKNNKPETKISSKIKVDSVS